MSALKRMPSYPLCLLYIIVITVTNCCVVVRSLESDDDICKQPPETGSCRAHIPQWYFNSTTNQCAKFIYGGCPGSRNRFSTREECVQRCSPDICSLPPVTGPCKAMIRLWYFDPSSRSCHQFTYGGCEGNENKFNSEHTCLVSCGKSSVPCTLGETFLKIGDKAVHEDYKEKEYFLYKCQSRCEEMCLEDHPWGHCMAYSTRKRWYGCNCYMYGRYVSESEFDQDTKGETKNRNCMPKF